MRERLVRLETIIEQARETRRHRLTSANRQQNLPNIKDGI